MRRALAISLLLLPAPLQADPATYTALTTRIRAEQGALQARWKAAPDAATRAALVSEARALVFDHVVHELIPAWEGTPWEFYGTTETPGEGTIACGYYVSTLLRDAGFRVERVKLAQQASEHIIQTLTPEDLIWRTSDAGVTRSLSPLEEHGDGLYMVGLDCHVGLLVREDGAVRFCDASYLAPTAVTCHDPQTAFSYRSRYRVIGMLLSDDMMRGWLEGRAFSTVTGRR
ncbi:MAG: hypothetical protein ABIO70_03675 [Pseudomonadota bacterium]